MPINITVRERTATTGGTADTIPGEGSIDNATEADAALAKLPAGDGSVIVVGGETYDRVRLQGIVNGTPPPPAPTPNPDPAAAIPVEHPSSGYSSLGLRGGYSLTSGPYGHPGGVVQLFAERSFQIGSGDFSLVAQGTIDYQHGGRNGKNPGGGPTSSELDLLGGGADAIFRFAPTDILDGHLYLDAGLGVAIAKLTTPANTYENLPRIACTASTPDVPPIECEKGANPGRANTGETGLANTHTGSSQDAEGGTAIQLRVPVTIGYEVPINDYAVAFQAGAEISYLGINPNVGTGGKMWKLTPTAGVAVHF